MDYMDIIRECQNNMALRYPDLKMRWVRIYGKRWAHLYGDSSELSACSPLKIEIEPNFGLCIDNSEIVPAEELETMLETIKERFSHVDMV